MTQIKPELLAPAGDLEKLRFALLYGADAVYIGGQEFSLRAGANNFSSEEICEGVRFAHGLNKKIYLAVNIYAKNADLDVLPDYLAIAQEAGIDALIISDPGVFAYAREFAPKIPIHISTQANTGNWRAAKFWQEAGAKRVILARELNIAEMKTIGELGGLETEAFVHGAMCISYSGRCLLSSFLVGRDANRGDCAHPCRWNYRLEEEKRPGSYFPIEEDKRGSYIFNSKDLCLLPLINELLEANLSSWKIEGRNKSAYYVANITRIYRQAIDAAMLEKEDFYVREDWLEEIGKVSHREFTTAFATGKPDETAYRYDDTDSIRSYDFAGVIHEINEDSILVEQRNHLALGDEAEIILPDGENIILPIGAIYDEEGNSLEAARHPRQMVRIPANIKAVAPLIIRRKQR